jgi:RNA polymerase sigma factor (sigma-70 family)
MDLRAQQILFEKYYGNLLKIAFRYAGTYEQAVEMTHNGFLPVFQKFTEFRGAGRDKIGDSLPAWIRKFFVIALVDRIMSEPRLHWPRPIPGDLWKQEKGRVLSDEEIREVELIKIVKGLPVPYRLVFNLFVIDGFPHQEIARMLGISVGESEQRLFKAREFCKIMVIFSVHIFSP